MSDHHHGSPSASTGARSRTAPGRDLIAVVIVSSNRAAAGVYDDTSGPILTAGLSELGCRVDPPVVVADGEAFRAALSRALSLAPDLVLTSGGTGCTPGDVTPEITAGLLDRQVPGIAEAIRHRAERQVPTAVLSRGLAGISGSTLVVNLPGSTGGAKDGLAVLGPILGHTLDQIRGGDHAGSAAAEGVGPDDGRPGLATSATGEQPRHGDHRSPDHSRIGPARHEVVRAIVGPQPLSQPEHEEAVSCDTAGAVVGFAGVVRNHDHERSVRGLEYEAHPGAQAELLAVAAEIAAAEHVDRVAVSHRTGPLVVGDVALAAAVSCAHRAEAFAACAQLVERVKARVPIWKHQRFTDGNSEWVNLD